MKPNEPIVTVPLPTLDHRAEPIESPSGALFCRHCGRPVRTANGGQHPIHASVVIEPRDPFNLTSPDGGHNER